MNQVMKKKKRRKALIKKIFEVFKRTYDHVMMIKYCCIYAFELAILYLRRQIEHWDLLDCGLCP